MNKNKIIEFDLAIFDRVLYLINEKKFIIFLTHMGIFLNTL